MDKHLRPPSQSDWLTADARIRMRTLLFGVSSRPFRTDRHATIVGSAAAIPPN